MGGAGSEVLEPAFAALEDGIVIHDRDGRVATWNPAAQRMLGIVGDELPEVRLKDGTRVTRETGPVAKVLATGTPQRCLLEVLPVDGAAPRWVWASVRPLDAGGAVCRFTEVSDRSPRDAFSEMSLHMRALFGDPDIYAQVVDADGRFLFVTARFASTTGLDREAILGRTLEDVLGPEARVEHDRALSERRTVMAEETRRGQTFLALRFPFLDARGEPWAVGGVSVDVSDMRARADRLEHAALHDPLTQLANRRLLEEHLGLALARARRQKTTVAVVFFDVDGLKTVNDRHGHEAGDELLREIAGRLQRAVRQTDAVARHDGEALVARHGGDEFLLVLADLPGDGLASFDAVRERLERVLTEPYEVDGVGVSFGASFYPVDGDTPLELLRRADEAMYEMKRGR